MSEFGPSNISTAIVQRSFQEANKGLVDVTRKMASGERIERASDDPAGLVRSENLELALEVIDAETRALERTDHVARTADSALGEVSDLLDRAEALAVANESSSGLSDAEREANEMELSSIMDSVRRLQDSTSFANKKLLDGTAKLEAAGQEVELERVDVQGVATGDVEAIRSARQEVATQRGRLGALSSQAIGSELGRLRETFEQTAAAASELRDTDYAQETAELARLDLMAEVSGDLLAATQVESQSVLQLLG